MKTIKPIINFSVLPPHFRRYRKRFFLAALALPFTAIIPASAAELLTVAALSEDDFLADIPVVLTATRLAQPVTEVPAAITIIDQEMIRASGSREIADLFRMVPGFVVSRDSGHVPIVNYHGLSEQYAIRMQMLIDGRSVYSPIFGGIDWTNLPLAMDDIERIEIIRGPNAASYGSNSFLAVINIITKHASETTGTFLRGTQGSNGAKDTYARYGETTGDFDYRVTAGIKNDDGFKARADHQRMKTARFRADYQINGVDSLMIQTGVTRGKREIDSEFLSAVEDRDIKINFEQIKWQRQINNNGELSLQFFHTLEDNKEIFDATVPPIGRFIRDTSTRAERFDFELQHTKQFNPDIRFVWGVGLRQDSAKAPQIFGTDPATGYTGNKNYFYNKMYRLFSNTEWRVRSNVTINAGLMLEESTLSDKELSPRLGVNYSITPEQSLRFVASKATRLPSLNEAKSNFKIPVEGSPPFPPSFATTIWVGNNNLKPEEVTAYELAYHAYFSQKKTSFDLKLFHEEIRGLIFFDDNPVGNPNDILDGEHFFYENRADAKIKGIEANLDFYPLRETRVIISRSYTTIDSNSDDPTVSLVKLDESGPKHITSILALNRFPGGMVGSVMYYRVSGSNGLGSGEPLPGYKHVNLRLALPHKWFGATGEIAFVIQNATGEYIDWRSENISETQKYISISAQWD